MTRFDRAWIAAATAFAVLCPSPLSAEGARYIVRFGSFPPIEISNAAVINPLSRSTAVQETGPAIAPATPRPVTAPEPVQLPATLASIQAGQATSGIGLTDLVFVTASDPLPPGEPPPEFAREMLRLYGIGDAPRLDFLWRIVRNEPKELPDRVRWSNGVVKWALYVPGQIKSARTDDLDVPAPTRVIRAESGVSVRASPYGLMIGSIPNGTQVRVIGRENIWFQVEAGGVRGWVAGLWARAE